jgi:hypothetical protein
VLLLLDDRGLPSGFGALVSLLLAFLLGAAFPAGLPNLLRRIFGGGYHPDIDSEDRYIDGPDPYIDRPVLVILLLILPLFIIGLAWWVKPSRPDALLFAASFGALASFFVELLSDVRPFFGMNIGLAAAAVPVALLVTAFAGWFPASANAAQPSTPTSVSAASSSTTTSATTVQPTPNPNQAPSPSAQAAIDVAAGITPPLGRSSVRRNRRTGEDII